MELTFRITLREIQLLVIGVMLGWFLGKLGGEDVGKAVFTLAPMALIRYYGANASGRLGLRGDLHHSRGRQPC